MSIYNDCILEGGENKMHKDFLKDLKFNLDNKGEEIVISIKGEKEKLAHLEKKLKAIHELCCGDGGCCHCC